MKLGALRLHVISRNRLDNDAVDRIAFVRLGMYYLVGQAHLVYASRDRDNHCAVFEDFSQVFWRAVVWVHVGYEYNISFFPGVLQVKGIQEIDSAAIREVSY